MPTYYPTNDQEFESFLGTLIARLPDVMTDLTLPATFDDALIAASTAFSTALATHVSSQSQAVADRMAKDAAKGAAVLALRAVVNQLRGNPGFTPEMAGVLTLPVYDTERTPIEAGEEVPTLSVDTGAPQHHRILFSQLTGELGESVSKPSWARACRIMYKVVATNAAAPPIEEMDYLASDTSSPYELDFAGSDVGKDVWYRGSWETPKGDHGPWSDPAKGTVTG